VEHFEEIMCAWMQLHDEYPEIHTAIQTRHALQSIIHHKSADLERLFDEGLLDDAERQKMSVLLSQTQHNLYYTSFYYAASAHRSTDDYADTVNAVPFMAKIEDDDNREALLSDMNSSKHITEHSKDSTIELGAGIYIILSGSCVMRTTRRDPSSNIGENKTKLSKGGVMGCIQYLKDSYADIDSDVDAAEDTEIETEYTARTNVVLYFMSESVLKRVFESESEARDTLWRQCAAKLIVSMYRRNNTAFFAFYRQTDVNIMCQKSTFVEVAKGETKELTSFMALLLFGRCQRVSDGTVYRHKHILLAGYKYEFFADAKLLVLDYDPEPGGPFNRKQRQESAVRLRRG